MMSKTTILTLTTVTALWLQSSFIQDVKYIKSINDDREIKSCINDESTKDISQFSVLGKWQRTAESASNGSSKTYTTKIKDGEILIFEKNQILKDQFGNTGTYNLTQGKLKISLNKKAYYYFVYFDGKDSDKMYFNPVTPDYQIICDEGCSYTYTRIK